MSVALATFFFDLSMCPILSYIGPGAGFAAAGTLIFTLLAVLLTILNLIVWPVRRVWRWARMPSRGAAKFRRIVVIGLDGLDPRRTERLMAAGAMPNFRRIAAGGTFTPLASTIPPISPVAWSSFLTGVNPGKHGIFDFVARDPRTCLPRLSSAEVSEVKSFGGLRLRVKGLRRSEPFWKKLGQYGVPASVLRVPITFPPEPFEGHLLSAMCIPDLRGTQSSYTHFSTAVADAGENHPGGLWLPLAKSGEGVWEGTLPGPALGRDREGSPRGAIESSLVLTRNEADYRLEIGNAAVNLAEGTLSPWICLKFRINRWKSVTGLVRARITHVDDQISLYLTPMQIDPGRPAMPIGHPWLFPIYLRRLIGPYATAGLAEDTSALNDGVIDRDTFLELAKGIHDEREAMAMEILKQRHSGLVTCVFDGPDRIQHMFFGEEPSPEGGLERGEFTTIDRAYRELDGLVGRVSELTRPDDLLLVISDHGFTRFEKGIDLNRLLEREGLLAWLEGSSGSGYSGIDWSRTSAYAFGLSGIYLNLAGREAHGIVAAGEAEALAGKISELIEDLRDPETNQRAVSRVYFSSDCYQGPYSKEGPDLIIGYAEGYRVSWDCASGNRGNEIFTLNDRHWSGDHCVDRALVPGLLLSNHRLANQGEGASLIDLAPSILNWFGIPIPAYMDGTALQIT